MAQAPLLPIRARGPGLDLGRLLRTYSFGFALLLTVVLLIVNLIAQPDFGLTDQLAALAPLALAAMATTPAIIGGRGGIDLTISPLMTFTSIIFVFHLVPNGLGGAVAVPIVLAVGAAVGLANGLLIIFLRVPAVVVTLSTFFILIGVDLKMAPAPESIESSWVEHLAGSVGPIPGAVFTLAVPLVIWAALGLIPFKRMLYAVGSNDATAYSAGVNVAAVRVGAFALGGLFAAVGGFALTALTTTANGGAAQDYTLVALAALAMGGTSLWGGRGGVLGSLLGASAIYLVQNLITVLQVSTTWIQIMYGVMLLVAVIVGAKLTERREAVT